MSHRKVGVDLLSSRFLLLPLLRGRPHDESEFGFPNLRVRKGEEVSRYCGPGGVVFDYDYDFERENANANANELVGVH